MADRRENRALPLLVCCLSLSLESGITTADVISGVMSCTDWSAGPLCNTTQLGTTVAVTEKAIGAMAGTFLYNEGSFTVSMKFPKINSQGTITAFYLSDTVTSANTDPGHFEIDMEFYGNEDPTKIMCATNVFFSGEQNLAQFELWFDPSVKFHRYSIIWNQSSIIWLVNDVAVRILEKSPQHAWPHFPLLPLFTVWQYTWGPQANFSQGPIATEVQDFAFYGCRFSSPSDTGPCPEEFGSQHVWNRPLQGWQTKGLTFVSEGAINENLLLNDWGWNYA